MLTQLDIADVLFVATDLSILGEAATPSTLQDVDVEGRIYRPLDPAYYAWLRSRMEVAQTACKRGKLSAQAFDALRTRFNPLHDQAVALFGESALLDAVRLLDPKSYAPPGRAYEKPEERAQAPVPEPQQNASPGATEFQAPAKPTAGTVAPEQSPDPPCLDGWSKHAFPEEAPERFRFGQRVTRRAVAQVDAICDEALSKGWTEAELYQTRGRFPFPCGQQYGLVCFLSRGQRVGKVTEKNIEIVYPDGHALRFYRNEVTA